MFVHQEEKQGFPCMMLLITQMKDEKKLEEVLEILHVPVYYQFRAQGTAPSEIMDIFGLRGSVRLITITFLPKCKVQDVFSQLSRRLPFHRKGGGVAVTIPITGLQNYVLRMLSREINEEKRREIEEKIRKKMEGDKTEMKEKSEYSLVWVSVASGYSDEVVDAARNAGARGGTVMKGKRSVTSHAGHHPGIAVQEEQDLVMIIIPNHKKEEIMSAISHSCGMKSEAHGVVLSLPVEDVLGLEEE